MKSSMLHRKYSLIITTIDIIDELGISGLSTREIAKREGVSEATLFRHYKNKNQLLMAVLDYFSQFDEDIYQTTRLKGIKPVEAITFFIKSSVEYYENYPAITSVMQIFDVLRYEPELEDKVKQILIKRSFYMKQFIEEAKKTGSIRTDIDSTELSDIIIGFCREICLRWRLNNRQFSLKESTLSTLNLLLDTLRP